MGRLGAVLLAGARPSRCCLDSEARQPKAMSVESLGLHDMAIQIEDLAQEILKGLEPQKTPGAVYI